jgi:hypothetical protein
MDNNVEFQFSIRCPVSNSKQMSRINEAPQGLRWQPSCVSTAAPARQAQRRSPLQASTRGRRLVSPGFRLPISAHWLHRIDSRAAAFRNVAAAPEPRVCSSRGAPCRLRRPQCLRGRTQCVDAAGSPAPTTRCSRCRQCADRLCRTAGSCESGSGSGTVEGGRTWRRENKPRAYPRCAARLGTGADTRVRSGRRARAAEITRRRTGLRRSCADQETIDQTGRITTAWNRAPGVIRPNNCLLCRRGEFNDDHYKASADRILHNIDYAYCAFDRPNPLTW